MTEIDVVENVMTFGITVIDTDNTVTINPIVNTVSGEGGATGTFTSQEGKTVNVINGLVVSIIEPTIIELFDLTFDATFN